MSQEDDLGGLRAHIEHLREGQERIERQVADGFRDLRGLLLPLDGRVGVIEREQAEARGQRRAIVLVFTMIQGALAAILTYIWRTGK